MPKEVIISIAECLDHESLVHLGATCSSLQQLVMMDLDSHWRMLHNHRWRNGKRLRFNGPPSLIPRGRAPVVDADLNWREEFIRRFVLDKSVPGILERFKTRGFKWKGDSDVATLVEEHQADVFDQLKLLCGESEYSDGAQKMLISINANEAKLDWQNLHIEANVNRAGYKDGLFVISKLFQQSFTNKNSTDEIYDDINRELYGLTLDDLEGFETVDARESGGVDAYLIEKVLKNKRGTNFTLLAIANSRVEVLRSRLDAKVEFWHCVKTALALHCVQ